MSYELLIADGSGGRRAHSVRRGDMPSEGNIVELAVDGKNYEMTVISVDEIYRESGSVWRVTVDATSAVLALS